jgi:hypothetical protein
VLKLAQGLVVSWLAIQFSVESCWQYLQRGARLFLCVTHDLATLR